MNTPAGTPRTASGVSFYVIRSDRRTLSLEVNREGRVTARAPRRMPLKDIDAFVALKAHWIRQKQALAAERPAPSAYTPAEEQALRQRGRQLLPTLVARYAPLLGVAPARVKITSAAKRLGSCSSKGTLCFSWRLFHYPLQAIEYVVVHELAHLIHLNHSAEFYQTIARILPDWKERKALLAQPPADADVNH